MVPIGEKKFAELFTIHSGEANFLLPSDMFPAIKALACDALLS
jgi:hypothetical protein